jgi:hypothetical protein
MQRKTMISAIVLILAVTVWGAVMRSSASQPMDETPLPGRGRLGGGGFSDVANASFGLCYVSAADNLADETRYAGALATGARWDRWPLYWYWVDEGGYVGPHSQPPPGGYHDYDTLVIQEIEHGLTPIAILLGTPNQRATGGSADVPPPRVQDKVFPMPGQLTMQQGEASTAASPPAGLFEPIFADGTDVPGPGKAINRANSWADFVSNTVQRYKPGGDLALAQGWGDDVGIRYWEVWNEPDLDRFWSGTVEEYYRLLEVAYQTIRVADPEAIVILGGLAFFEKGNWLPDLLAKTGGDPTEAYFDVLSFHYYWNVYHGGTEHWLWETRNTLSAYGLSDVPIWVTESGVPVWDDFPATNYGALSDSPYRGTMEEQAAYVIQNAALAFYQGVERYYHFMLHDDCGNVPDVDAFGLRQNFSPHPCNPSGTNPQGKRRPSYAAYQLIVEQYRDLIPLWRTKSSEQDQVAFYRADDQSRVLALWATGGVTVTTAVSATGDTGQLYWIEPISSPLGITGITGTLTLTPTSGVYTLTLPPATNQNSWENWIGEDDPNYYIGGQPYLLVERDTLPPASSVEPLLPASSLGFVVRWGGEDLGSGIASYDVFYSVDGGPFTTWFTETLSTSASCAGSVGSTFGFAVRARDRAGNVEPIPTAPQATTLVVAGVPVSGLVMDADGGAVVGATVTISGTNTLSEVVSGEGGLWSAALQAGDYAFDASAPGYGTWPAPRHVTISDLTPITLTLAPLVNAVTAGDFEGPEVWEAWGRPNGEVSLSTEAFDGQAAALLGGSAGRPVICAQNGQPGELWTLKQTVSVPQGYPSTLSFLSAISTTQTDFDYAWLEVVVMDDGQPHYLVPWGELWRASDWTLTSLDLSAWQGQTVDVLFQVVHCSAPSFTATLDRVSVGSARLPYRVFIPLMMKSGETFLY